MLLKRMSVALMVTGLSISCASSRLHTDGLKAIASGNYEEGLSQLEQAALADPGNLEYRITLKARHDDIVNKLLGQADRALGADKLDDAEQLFKRVLGIEPGKQRAQRGLDGIAADRRHAVMTAKASEALETRDFESAETVLRAILAEDPGFAPAIAMQTKIETIKGPIKITPRLKARGNKPVTLQFRDANTKMVFEVLSRETGINFIFDKDIKSDGKTTIFVQQVPVEQAIELVLGQNQLARQVLSDNMVLIYPNTAAKQKEYQDEIVKTFYLTNTDPKKAQELLKTVLNTKTLFVDDKANLLIMRDTPEAVRMAEKLIASLDLAESEVMLEVEVLEINRSNLQQLGINYPTSATLSTPRNLNLDSIGRLNTSDISVTPLTISIDALKQVGMTNTLASPRIRARNREKAKILIGSRVPVITNSVTPTAGGTSVVTGNVQYLDVGLTLEVEPTVHLDNAVSIKLNLEVSSIIKEVTTGTSGTLAYEIGTRNAQTLLSLRDGETQILAGLISDQEKRSSSHIPGLGDIPIVGRLFGSNRTDKEKTEIVLSITPRIIRSTARPSSETTEFWYGTESNIRSAPLGSQSDGSSAARDTNADATANNTSPAAAGAAMEATVVTDPAPVASATHDNKAATAGAPIAAAAATGAAAGSLAAAAAESPTPAAREKPQSASDSEKPILSWSGTAQAKAGQDLTIVLNLSSQQPLTRIKSQLHFDQRFLRLVGADPGAIVPGNLSGGTPPRVNARAGVVQFVVPATKESPVQGDGSFISLHFKALAPTPSAPISVQFTAANSEGANVPLTPPAPIVIAVTQ